METDPPNRDDTSKSESPNFPEAWQPGDAEPAGGAASDGATFSGTTSAGTISASAPSGTVAESTDTSKPSVDDAEPSVAASKPPVVTTVTPAAKPSTTVAKSGAPVSTPPGQSDVDSEPPVQTLELTAVNSESQVKTPESEASRSESQVKTPESEASRLESQVETSESEASRSEAHTQTPESAASSSESAVLTPESTVASSELSVGLIKTQAGVIEPPATKILSAVPPSELPTDDDYSSQNEARATLAAISKAMEERSKQPLQRSDKFGSSKADSSQGSAILTIVSRPSRDDGVPKKGNDNQVSSTKPVDDLPSESSSSVPLRIVPAVSARDAKRAAESEQTNAPANVKNTNDEAAKKTAISESSESVNSVVDKSIDSPKSSLEPASSKSSGVGKVVASSAKGRDFDTIRASAVFPLTEETAAQIDTSLPKSAQTLKSNESDSNVSNARQSNTPGSKDSGSNVSRSSASASSASAASSSSGSNFSGSKAPGPRTLRSNAPEPTESQTNKSQGYAPKAKPPRGYASLVRASQSHTSEESEEYGTDEATSSYNAQDIAEEFDSARGDFAANNEAFDSSSYSNKSRKTQPRFDNVEHEIELSPEALEQHRQVVLESVKSRAQAAARAQSRSALDRSWMAVIITAIVAGAIGAMFGVTMSQRVVSSLSPADMQSSSSGHDFVAEIASRVMPTVVNISVAPPGMGEDSQIPKLAVSPEQKALIAHQMHSLGAGVVIRSDGYVVTSAHVVRGQTNPLFISLSNGASFPAKVVGKDPFTDIAVVKIDATNLPVAKFAGDKTTRPGDWAIAVGTPFGFDHSVSLGVVSAIGRSLSDLNNHVDLIQTDAAMNPGNSGGPLFNSRGEVIGINAVIRGGAQNIGFSVPSEVVKWIAGELIAHGDFKRPYIGIVMAELTPEGAKQLGIDRGVVVTEVVRNSPCDKAGLSKSDVILRLNGRNVDNIKDARETLKSRKPGDVMQFVFSRKGIGEQTRNVLVGEFPYE